MNEVPIERRMAVRIRYWREQKGMKNADVARALGLSPATVSKWQSEAACPTQENLDALCQLFGIQIWQFWAGSIDEMGDGAT